MLALDTLYSHNQKLLIWKKDKNEDIRQQLSVVHCVGWLNLAAVPEYVGKGTADTIAEARSQPVRGKILACRTWEVLGGHKHEDQAGTDQQL